MTTIFPGADYRSFVGALTDTNKTEIFAMDTSLGLPAALLVYLRVVDSTGSVATALTVHAQLTTGDTERVFQKTSGAIAAGTPYEYTGPAVRFGPGGTIDLTGGADHHWFLTMLVGANPAGTAQQRNI